MSVKRYSVNLSVNERVEVTESLHGSLVKYHDYAALEARCAALAAENAGLKAICEDRRMFIMNGVQLGYIQVPTVETDPALETIRIAVSPKEPIPATDSFMAEVRAQGVEMAVDVVKQCYDNICAGGLQENREYEESIVQPHLDGIDDELNEIIAQLRKGVQS